jgi:hypothetical protein
VSFPRAAMVALVAGALTAGCVHRVAPEIRRDRAVELARREARFTPSAIAADKATSQGRLEWRVTLRGRLPGQPPLLFETLIVEIRSTDR